jgi:hypothetical protein
VSPIKFYDFLKDWNPKVASMVFIECFVKQKIKTFLQHFFAVNTKAAYFSKLSYD